MKKSTRMLAVLLTAVMLLGMFPMSVFANDAQPEDGLLQTFRAKFVSGATKNAAGDYVWTPDGTQGHEFIYRVTYAFSGIGEYAADSIEIRVPKSVLRDRSGNTADKYDISVPEAGTENLPDTAYFVYTVDGDDIVITNRIPVAAGWAGYIDIGYVVTKSAFDYVDYGGENDESAPFEAEISVTRDGKTDTAADEADHVFIDTNAKVTSTQKAQKGNLITEWDKSWGPAPADAGDYYYLVWTLTTAVTANQPYRYEINDIFEELDGEIVGYKLQGESRYSDVNYIDNCRFTGTRYDYVLTKHLKSTYDRIIAEQTQKNERRTYKLTNSETVTVTPADMADPASSKTGNATFTYEMKEWRTPNGKFIFHVYGIDYNGVVNTKNESTKLSSYELEDLKEGNPGGVEAIENLRYTSYVTGNPYPWTVDGDVNDPASYGKVPVKVFIENYTFNLPDGEPLGPDDYEITSITPRYSARTATFSENEQNFVSSPAVYGENDYFNIYVKTESGDPVLAAVYHLNTDEYTDLNGEFVDGVSGKDLLLKPGTGVTGYAIETFTAMYSFEYGSYVGLTLKRSDDVLEKIGSDPRTRLTDNGVATVTDNGGENLTVMTDFGDDFLMGIERVGSVKKSVLSYRNDKINRKFKTTWQAQMSETYHDVDSSLKYVEQQSGVFYDLLPEGANCDVTSVKAYADGTELRFGSYTVSTVENYAHGQTLLVVRIRVPAEQYKIEYTTYTSWDALKDYGSAFLNAVAYETGNATIGSGRPDDGGTIRNHEYMADLDPDTDDKKFIYADYSFRPSIVTSGNIGLYKKVLGNDKTDYSESAETSIGDIYSYQLRFATDLSEKATDLVLYDSLENYKGVGGSDWYGSYYDIDLSQAEKLGIAPVVYFSTVEDLAITEANSVDNASVWTAEEDFTGDKSDITAVAVDLRKDSFGADYEMPVDTSVNVRIFMLAPAVSPESEDGYPTAYNNTYLNLKHINVETGLIDEESELIHQDYTQIKLKVTGDVELKKVSEDDEEITVEGAVFRIYGTSAYGNTYDKTFATAPDGTITVEDLEMGDYLMQEIESPDDYFINETLWHVTIDDSGRTIIDNAVLEDCYVITDKTRIHGDLPIHKIGEIDNSDATKGLSGVTFRLVGTSDYGTVCTLYAVTDAGGKTAFYNIEKGEYTLTEIATAEGYQLPVENEWTVICDDTGFVYVEGFDALSGEVEIINEPFHSFSFFKLNAANRSKTVEGAVFTLTGISGKGTVVDMTAVSDANGVVTFSDLEAGTYTLTEIEAPENYKLDPTPYTVTVAADGTVTGLDKLSAYWSDVTGFEKYFAVLNEPEYNGEITVVKKWDDNEEDTADRPIPVVHISTEEPEFNKPYATFDHDLWIDFKAPYLNQIYPKQTPSPIEEVRRSYDAAPAANAVKVDDGTTDYSIYAWCDEDAQIIYWWTDAAVAFLPEDASNMFAHLDSCKSIDLKGISAVRTTNMSYFFDYDKCLVSLDLSGLDTSNVTDMSYMFADCAYICDAVSDWSILDTSSCTNMSYMFYHVEADEMDISPLDVSNVRNTSHMFQGSKIKKLVMQDMVWSSMYSPENMQSMFYLCDPEMTLDMSGSAFPGLSGLVSGEAGIFAKSNIKELILKDCDFSGVTRLDSSYNDRTGPFMEMLYLTKLDLSGANFASLTSMGNLFNVNFTSSDYSKRTRNLEWFSMEGAYTPKLEYLNSTFYVCEKLAYVNLAGIDATHVKNLASTFCGCKALETIDFTGTTFTSLLYLSSLFEGCNMLSSVDLSKFDTSGVTTMENMFRSCNALTELDLSSFDTSSVTIFDSMFRNCTNLKTIRVSDGWTVSGSATGSSMFDSCSALVGEKGTSYDVHHVIGKTYAHVDGGTDDPGYLTYKAAVPFTPYVPEAPVKPVDPDTPDEPEYEPWLMLIPGVMYDWDTDEMLPGGFNDQFKRYFGSATAFRKGDAMPADGVTKYDFTDTENSDPDTHIWLWQDGDTVYWYPEGADPYITYNLNNMFAGCTNLKSVDLTGFRGTYTMALDGKEYPMVETASYMFEGCTSLEEVNFGDLTFGGFVDEYEDWWYGCQEVEGMFRDCTSLKHLDLSGLTLESIWNAASMFEGCTSLIDVKMPDFAPLDFGVTEGMFAGCSSLETVYVSERWQMAEYSEGEDMFDGCVKLVGQNGTAYSADHTDWEYARIDENGTPGYFTYMEPTTREPIDPINPKTKTYDSNSEMGVEGDLEKWIDNGDGTWSYTFKVFDEDNTYFVWEDDVPTYLGDITVLNPEQIQYVAHKGAPVVTITNSKEYTDGGLILRKQVEGTLTREEQEKAFTFTVTVNDLPDGWYGSAEFVNGVATVSLKAGESVSISEIPAGLTYTVVETDHEGFDVTYENASGTVEAGKVVTVSATNTKIVHPTGALNVKKIVTGDNAEATQTSFPFTVTLTGDKISGTQTFGGFTFTDGVLNFTLKAGESITISELPAGTAYTVTEELPDFYVQEDATGCIGTIVENVTAQAVITNRPIPELVIGGKCSFVLEKQLNGFATTDEYLFTVIIEGLRPNATYTVSDGTTFTANAAGIATYTASLAGGESLAFNKLPLGTAVTVIESACDYKASYRVVEGGTVVDSAVNGKANTDLSTKRRALTEGLVPTFTFTNSPDVWRVGFAKTNDMGEFIAGALLQILNSDGLVVHEWTSSDDEMEEVELQTGSYVLHEVSAPSGYGVADDIAFTVSEDGQLIVDDEEVGTFLVMEDPRFDEIVPDVVVIDYGIPVDIDATMNDPYDNTIHSIGKTAPEGYDINTGISDDAFFSEKKLTFENGTFEIVGNEIRFTPKTMIFDEPITIYYDTAIPYYKNGETHTEYLYSSVTVVPATTIYYEDDFVTFSGDWESAGTYENKLQDQDRPGFSGITVIDADDIYGYDPAYSKCAEYSLGSTMKATVSKTQKLGPTATFTFVGRGFDIISLTDPDQGLILIQVFEGEDTTGTPKYYWAVDNYYGYTLDKMPNLTLEDNGTLYQIPVVRTNNDLLPYGKYTVVIIPIYDELHDIDKNGSYDFCLDAIRIFDPAYGNDFAEGCYLEDNEAYPQYIEIRNQLLGQGAFDTEDAKITGAVFIDDFGLAGTLADYYNYGPNNEVYLGLGQSIAFKLTSKAYDKVAAVHLGAKCVNGDVSFAVNGSATPFTISTCTDMFYDITPYVEWSSNESDVIIITNNTENVLSITDIKITYTADPSGAPAQLLMTRSAARSAAGTVLSAYESALDSYGNVFYRGDVNGDGAVNAKDLNMLRKALAQDDTAGLCAGADVNGDGIVGAADVIKLRRILSELDKAVKGIQIVKD